MDTNDDAVSFARRRLRQGATESDVLAAVRRRFASGNGDAVVREREEQLARNAVAKATTTRTRKRGERGGGAMFG